MNEEKKVSLKTSIAQTGKHCTHTCVQTRMLEHTHLYTHTHTTVWLCVGEAWVEEVRTSCMEGVIPEQIRKAVSEWTGGVQPTGGARWGLRIESQETDPQVRMWVQQFFLKEVFPVIWGKKWGDRIGKDNEGNKSGIPGGPGLSRALERKWYLRVLLLWSKGARLSPSRSVSATGQRRPRKYPAPRASPFPRALRECSLWWCRTLEVNACKAGIGGRELIEGPERREQKVSSVERRWHWSPPRPWGLGSAGLSVPHLA